MQSIQWGWSEEVFQKGGGRGGGLHASRANTVGREGERGGRHLHGMVVLRHEAEWTRMSAARITRIVRCSKDPDTCCTGRE